MNKCIRCRKKADPGEFPFPEELRGKGVRVPSLMPGKRARSSGRKRSTVCRECWDEEIKRKQAERDERAKQRTAKTRKCRKCGRRKALTAEHFDPLKPYADGTPQFRWQCVDCRRAAHKAHHAEVLADPERRRRMKERVRKNGQAWKRNNRERDHELQKGYRERVKADPARRERRNAENRMTYRLKRIRAGLPVKMAPRGSATGPRLPAGPLKVVLSRRISRNCATLESLCEDWGVNPREVRAYLSGERSQINASKADEYLTALGLHWWDVWWCDEHDDLDSDCSACRSMKIAVRAF